MNTKLMVFSEIDVFRIKTRNYGLFIG